MAPRPTETDALQRVAAALIIRVVMDRLMSLFPAAARPSIEAPPVRTPEPPDRAEDLAIQQAIDEALEYHRTHRPKNTTKNYEPKQAEWRVSPSPPRPYAVHHCTDRPLGAIGVVQEDGLQGGRQVPARRLRRRG